MRLGVYLGYARPGTNPTELVELAVEAEHLGLNSAWAAEAWGTDAVTVLAWLAARTTRIHVGSAIMQIAARTPAATAMTAATLDLMSGGRVRLGLGVWGPQVVEGWHGQPWGKPLGKTREYVEIVRAILRRETIEHGRRALRDPLRRSRRDRPRQAAEADGCGRSAARCPIYLAAMAPPCGRARSRDRRRLDPLFFVARAGA